MSVKLRKYREQIDLCLSNLIAFQDVGIGICYILKLCQIIFNSVHDCYGYSMVVMVFAPHTLPPNL